MGESRVQIVGPNDLSEGTLTSMAPAQTDRFAHIRRMRDSRFPYEIATILPGEFFVSSDPMIVYTVLGSCVAACIRDPIAGVGGMNHFMLPKPRETGNDSWALSTRYGSYAMESLINDILKCGGSKSRLEIKLFGAGRIHDANIDVGARNAEWVLDYLQAEGLTACKTDLGDVFPRRIYYFTESGRVLMKKIEPMKDRTIAERDNEDAARMQSKEQVPTEDVILF